MGEVAVMGVCARGRRTLTCTDRSHSVLTLQLHPACVAGHSRAEYTAAVACGSLGAAEGMALVSERGRLMSQVQPERPGAMAAVIGLPVETLEELCRLASDTGPVGLAN